MADAEQRLQKRREYYHKHKEELKAKSLKAYYDKKAKMIADGFQPRPKGRPPKYQPPPANTETVLEPANPPA